MDAGIGRRKPSPGRIINVLPFRCHSLRHQWILLHSLPSLRADPNALVGPPSPLLLQPRPIPPRLRAHRHHPSLHRMPHHHYWRHTPLPLNHIAAKTYAPITHLSRPRAWLSNAKARTSTISSARNRHNARPPCRSGSLMSASDWRMQQNNAGTRDSVLHEQKTSRTFMV